MNKDNGRRHSGQEGIMALEMLKMRETNEIGPETSVLGHLRRMMVQFGEWHE